MTLSPTLRSEEPNPSLLAVYAESCSLALVQACGRRSRLFDLSVSLAKMRATSASSCLTRLTWLDCFCRAKMSEKVLRAEEVTFVRHKRSVHSIWARGGFVLPETLRS